MDHHGPGPDRGRHRGTPAGDPGEPLPDRRPHVRSAAPAAHPGRRAAQPGGAPPRQRGRPRLPRPTAGRAPAGSSTRRPAWKSLDRLEEASMLPAIFFIFSRNGCDEAARSTDRGRRPPDHRCRARPHPRDRRRPRRPASTTATWPYWATGRSSPGWRPASPPTTQGWSRRSRKPWRPASPRGWSRSCSPPRHWPSGINMPARTVVIEKLSKFTGDHHEFLESRRLHPAHRTGRAAGHRRAGLRRGPVEPLRPLRPGVGTGFEPFVPAQLGVPARPTT